MTEIAIHMPPIPSISSDEIEDEVAFRILNQDNLPVTMTISGEQPILRPFGGDHQKIKPNVIVHPTRRAPSTTNLEENKQKPFAQSSGNINADEKKSLRKGFSNSYGNLLQETQGRRLEGVRKQLDNKFTKALDLKLRKLQKEEKQQNKKNVERKPFVTTVKKGEFLEPPPEIATLIGIKVEDASPPTKKETKEAKKLYAFASQPRILNRSPTTAVHASRCEAAAKAAAKLVGSVAGMKVDGNEKPISDAAATTPYANVMFDKRVARGTNFGPSFGQGDGESSVGRAEEARRRMVARRKAKSRHIRASQLRLGSPPAVPGRRHEQLQTERYLEEMFLNPPTAETCTQTDLLFLERPISPFYQPAYQGKDAQTQIYPGDLFDFETEVQPILEVLVGKTIEQALIEVLEEEELLSLKEQQRRFLELRATETSKTVRLEGEEKWSNGEKKRRLEEGGQRGMEKRIEATMVELLPDILEGLQNDGVLMDNSRNDLDESFIPWLSKEVVQELQDMVTSRDVLTEIIREVLENRAEIYQALGKGEIEDEAPTTENLLLKDNPKIQEEIRQKEVEEAAQQQKQHD